MLPLLLKGAAKAYSLSVFTGSQILDSLQLAIILRVEVVESGVSFSCEYFIVSGMVADLIFHSEVMPMK
jgi:hypothetical protein